MSITSHLFLLVFLPAVCVTWRLANRHSSCAARLCLLGAAILCTGVGAAMSVDMKLVPNPGDGIVAAIAQRTGRELGFTKNWFDTANVGITLVFGLVMGHPLCGIGLGTVLAMLGVGRVMALFNRFFLEKLHQAAGMALPALETPV